MGGDTLKTSYFVSSNQTTNDRLYARLLVSLYHQADLRRAQTKEDVHATCLESQGKTQRVER